MRAMQRSALLVLLLAGCEACGGTERGSETPEALESVAEYAEVTRFDGWPAPPGLTLYRGAWAVPDPSSAKIVAVDEEGQQVAGAELMERFGALSPAELAERVLGVLMAEHGAQPLSAEQREDWSFGSDADWARVRPARIEDGVLIFHLFEGETAPEMVEVRVRLETWEITRQPMSTLASAAAVEPACLAWASCGCWSGCLRAAPVEPSDPEEARFRVIDGPHAGLVLGERAECDQGEECFRVCLADEADAECREGAWAPAAPEQCEETCPPSEAPYRCEAEGESCRRVEHPRRRRAR